MAALTTQHLVDLALSQGAVAAGVSRVDVFQAERGRLHEAVHAGRSGPLRFTFDDPTTATDVRQSFPWAHRLITVAIGYGGSPGPAPRGASVARFATKDHYEELRAVTASIERDLRERGHQASTLIDDGRLVDRGAAVRSGVGWWGRSTMVLTPGHGPWILLGSVVTDAPLEVTAPMTRSCGTCTACLPACPTGALSEESGLDARRCLATWLQTGGSIPHWIRPLLGDRIYGCDDCLTSCPPGHKAAASTTIEFDPAALLALSDRELLDAFPWWYVPRREGRFVRRNLVNAAGNIGGDPLIEALVDHLEHPSSMIRGHAASALARAMGSDASPMLRRAFEEETVREARDEITVALLAVEHPDAHAALLMADEWVHTTTDLEGFALLGSHASAVGGPTSDLDLLVLTARPAEVTPPRAIGEPHLGLPIRRGRGFGHQIQGPVPIDLVIAGLDWPTDPGGHAVLSAGIVPLHDPNRRFERLRRSP